MAGQVKMGLIGCGGMARNHMKCFGDVEGLTFVAAADPVQANLDQVSQDHPDVKVFTDGHELIKSGLCDAVLIATPHTFHPEYAIAAMQANLHVLCEKPVAVTVGEAARINAEYAKHPDLVYSIMFQMRTSPLWRKVKQIMSTGQLGKLLRVNWTCTRWYRSQAYYDSGAWRATWKGEGGGILMNQCPHNLDLLQWLTGKPSRISAQISLGKFNKIEVEDEVIATLTYPEGHVGVFSASTGEAPGTDYLEIAGEGGKLTCDTSSGKLEMWQNHITTSQFNKINTEKFAQPASDYLNIEPGGKPLSHQQIQQNFVNAILHGEELVVPGPDGIHSLEIANAMVYSGLKGQPVDLPMDADAYQQLLNELIANSRSK